LWRISTKWDRIGKE
jgi:hypothetical protein